jgi:hypothetical protein
VTATVVTFVLETLRFAHPFIPLNVDSSAVLFAMTSKSMSEISVVPDGSFLSHAAKEIGDKARIRARRNDSFFFIMNPPLSVDRGL